MTKDKQTENSANIAGRSVLRTLADLVFVALCAGLSTFYLYIGNLGEIYLYEVVPPLLIFVAIGWVLYIILRLILKKSPRKPAFLSGIAMVILTNAGMLTGALGYIFALAISAIVIAALFFVFIRLVEGAAAEKIEFILAGVMAALVVFNLVTAIPQFNEIKRLDEEADAKAAALEKIEIPAKYAKGDADLPNVYLFFFDELAGTKCMKEVFDYDNTGFYNDMRSIGFNVSDKCTNYEHFTFESLAGLFDMNYVFSYDKDGWLACRKQFANARFFSIMKDMGYNLYETELEGLINFEKRIDYGTNKEYCRTEDGYYTLDVVLGRTLFGPLVNELGFFASDYDLYNKTLDYYTLPGSYTYKNAMTFCILGCPHSPFLFDENGGRVDEANRMNWSDPKYYIDQYKYLSGRIVKTMKGIIKNDPDAMILVFSDHGIKMNKYLWNGPSTTNEEAIDSFFAVYTGGRDDLGNITGLSGANVLRTVLNKEYGFDLEMAGPPAD